MRALVVVDLQNDFLPGGPLGVDGGDEVAPVVNALAPKFELVAACQDWHPPDHKSFASQHPGKKPGDVIDLNGLEQILWPDHCVRETRGAEFDPRLDTSRFDKVFRKGLDPEIDSYSGFYDNGHRRATGLTDYLRERGVTRVVIAGLTTDYCVKFSALDAAGDGFEAVVVTDATRAVNLEAGDAERAFDEMRQAGVRLVTSAELLSA